MTEAIRKERTRKPRKIRRKSASKAAPMVKTAAAGELMIQGMRDDLKRWAKHPFRDISAL